MSFICHIHNYTEYNEEWNVFSAFNPSKCTHLEQWAADCAAPGEQSWTSCRSQDLNPQLWVTSGFKSNALSIRPTVGITVQSSYTSWRSCLLGHKFSSTSQWISSLAMQRGKNLLECLIQPLQASAVMSSHGASMAARRVICVCGWRSYTFHLHAEKNSSMGLRNGE